MAQSVGSDDYTIQNYVHPVTTMEKRYGYEETP